MEKKATCKNCNSDNIFGMSRVVGYYSIIENWNESKQAEFKDRQKGVYDIQENLKDESSSSKIEEEAIAVIAR